jgi:hypothetical protein
MVSRPGYDFNFGVVNVVIDRIALVSEFKDGALGAGIDARCVSLGIGISMGGSAACK